MPIKLPKLLPAREILENENIFVMDEDRAMTQDIRPLNILILNLMPEKEMEETQLLRHLGNTPLQVNVTFLKMATHESKNTSHLHLDQFYSIFDEVQQKKFDGMIITGAPVEQLPFSSVDYWNELKEMMHWSRDHVTSTLHICWGAQAALYYHFGVDKIPYPEKLSGVFSHTLYEPKEKLLRGFDDVFFAPHSRYTNSDVKALQAHPELRILSGSEEAGPFILMANQGKQIMITGHLEYDTGTLATEYERDLKKGLHPHLPTHYFPDDDLKRTPLNTWRSHAHLLFSNWLNYYVYQETPYQWD
ncbi:homoserine O-acetyltransferase MetA [Sporolactobacillus inulinus]|uniref:Homoserine O-acetyltransferase n=1 Tax=Sporolactobacillus inulinus CASD TaxID=1069536 RepID=A0A0U1QKG5_9BACL|nr:homoserine O-succinyltransferase [Sporolactobacillus inulinus]KLI01305.1 homoserine O-succinyltransferase [Sporolactobacillus inulinus CASD]GEB76121.1 homoserine O-succinyltransferase [Sporolactobacillus inulinus]